LRRTMEIDEAALDPLAAEWREKLEETLQPYRRLPLLLSGGTDSATILAALMVLNERPDCYTFQIGNHRSMDLRVAQKMCADFDLKLTICELDRSRNALVQDVRTVIQMLGTSGKAAVQCAQPIMHMATRIRADGYKRAIVGTGCICLDGRQVAVVWAQEGEEAARKLRADKHQDRHLDRGTGQMHKMAVRCGVQLEEPYTEEPVCSFGLSIDYAEMNRPKQKGIALRAYPGFWRRGYYRKNDPLQVGTGVREWHDTLLKDEELNPGGRHKAVVAIYNRMKKGMGL